MEKTGRMEKSYIGLSEEAVLASRHKYGTNALPKQKRTSFFVKFLHGFGDPIIRILLAALGINFLFFFQTFDIFETMGIVLAILLSTFISALSERGGERAFDCLQDSLAGEKCFVRRGGSVKEISTSEVVVGDLVLIEAGERIPADGILCAGEVTVSQAALNGEGRDAVKKQSFSIPDRWDPQNDTQLFRGSHVTSGEGVLSVCRVGENTLYGAISAQLQEETPDSPLKTRLKKLAKQMSVVGYIAAGLVALSYLVNVFILDTGTLWLFLDRITDLSFALPHLIRALALATTVIVVAVPEGLPMMISVVLASNMKRMQKDQVLVRKAVGIETAGSMNILFCDKTGTLTVGRPVVREVLTGDGKNMTVRELEKHPALFSLYRKNACGNTMSAVVEGKAVGGNATDRALLESVLSSRPGKFTIRDKIPFDSARKYSAATVDGIRFYKGAWEKILERANSYWDKNGQKMTLRDKNALKERIQGYAARQMRVLGVATEEGDGSFVLVAFLLIRDDVRRGAVEAVSQLHNAGIQVVMMTGDNSETAKAIAKEVGLLGGTCDLVLTSNQIAAYSDDQLLSILPNLRVVSRALPTDKSRLVRLARRGGLTVGMTGDGINDAPSLKAADVGFAMGSGTDVAKEAGDIVILDDKISSIAKAVLYGRTIFKSIRKFIVFQLTTNFCAVAVTIICPFLGIDSPVTVLQMLWINMIMDTFGSLAFAGEAPLPEYMKEPPKKRDTKILNGYMVCRILLSAFYIIFLCLKFITSVRLQNFYGFAAAPTVFLCAFFTLFIFSDLCNCFSARTIRLNPFSSLTKNKAFIAILAMIIGIQITMIYCGGVVFRTTPLSPLQFLIPLGLSLSVLPMNMIFKLILKLRKNRDTV